MSYLRLETDQELRTRIANKYGMWGAFLSIVREARGQRLDECTGHIELKRRLVRVEVMP